MTQILGQFCINVTDIDRSVKFWEETIGLTLQHRTEIDQAYEAVLQADEGGSRLQLAQQKDQDGPIDMGTAMWKISCPPNTPGINCVTPFCAMRTSTPKPIE